MCKAFWHHIQIPLVLDDGTSAIHRFEVKMRRVPAPEPTTLSEARESVIAIVDGWTSVRDDEGRPLPFTEANMRKLLDTCPGAIKAILDAHRNAMQADSQQEQSHV